MRVKTEHAGDDEKLLAIQVYLALQLFLICPKMLAT